MMPTGDPSKEGRPRSQAVATRYFDREGRGQATPIEPGKPESPRGSRSWLYPAGATPVIF
jgi:hypothetical protein